MWWKVLILIAGLVSCAPATTWVKHGANSHDFELDSTQCEIVALNTVPIHNVRTEVVPGYRSAEHTNCYSMGVSINCVTTGGTESPPVVLERDKNSQLRSRALAACLMQRGWREVEVGQQNNSYASQQRQNVNTTVPTSDAGRTGMSRSLGPSLAPNSAGRSCGPTRGCQDGLVCISNVCKVSWLTDSD